MPAGFEPAHPKIIDLESIALDHSAMTPFWFRYHLVEKNRLKPLGQHPYLGMCGIRTRAYFYIWACISPVRPLATLLTFVCCSVSEVKQRTEKYVLMAGLEPATLRLEVSRASIAPHRQKIFFIYN